MDEREMALDETARALVLASASASETLVDLGGPIRERLTNAVADLDEVPLMALASVFGMLLSAATVEIATRRLKELTQRLRSQNN